MLTLLACPSAIPAEVVRKAVSVPGTAIRIDLSDAGAAEAYRDLLNKRASEMNSEVVLRFSSQDDLGALAREFAGERDSAPAIERYLRWLARKGGVIEIPFQNVF